MIAAVEDWAEALRHFVAESRHLTGRRLVGVGHSLGATAMSATSYPLLGMIADTVSVPVHGKAAGDVAKRATAGVV